MSDTQKQAVQKQANGTSPKPKPQNNKNNNSNDGFKSVGKPRNQQNGANGSQKATTNKPKTQNNNNGNNNQQRRRKEGGNNNNKPKQQQGNQQAPSNPTLKGKISTEHYELVVEVIQGTGSYFSEQEAWATLQQNNNNVKTTIEVLNSKWTFFNNVKFKKIYITCTVLITLFFQCPQYFPLFSKFSLDKIEKRPIRTKFYFLVEKKGSNWSAIVRGGLPQEQPVQQPAPTQKTQSRPNQKKKADHQANGHQGKLAH